MPALIWQGHDNDTASGADGGWVKTCSGLDPDKSYISIQYVRRTSTGTSGSFYHGCHGGHTLNNSAGTANTNPYFKSFGLGTLPQNVWCVSIGYIWANNHTYTSHKGKCYRLDTGAVIGSNTDFRMKAGSTTQTHRTYLYYSTDSSVEVEWWNPGFYEIDGTEPSLAEITFGTVPAIGPSPVLIYNSAGTLLN